MKTLARLFRSSFVLVAVASFAIGLRGAELDADKQAKVGAKIAAIQSWAADPVIVSAVAEHNAALPTEHAEMTQAKWKTLSVLDPFVRSFSKNPAAAVLKANKADWVTEVFVSDAKGLKVAFLSKPSNWSHAEKPKHEVPMTGKSWEGAIETDESTGVQQLQVSVPVLQNGKAIGSLVVGLNLGKL